MERKVDINLAKTATASDKITDDEKAQRKARKAKLAEVLDRGVLGDRLSVQLNDPSLHYEWPHKDDVTRVLSLGFRYATADDIQGENPAIHNAGDGKIRIGDTVLLVCDKDTKNLIDEVKQERKNRVHAPKGGKQKEEQEFEQSADIVTQPKIESKVHKADARDITAALEAAKRDHSKG